MSSALQRKQVLPDAGWQTAGTQARFELVFVGWRKWVNWLGIAAWIGSLAYFWVWWFEPSHIDSIWRYVLTTVVLLWVTLIPAYFIVIFARARIPVGRPPANARIAMVVTKAPSEPFSVVSKTLEGMLAQEGVVHDTWLSDEDPDEATLQWCRDHGVQVSTRRGVAAYHRTEWPRRTRCKEGNLAYFYDHYGYDGYDLVAQFDADHIPSPTYLAHALTPFTDPAVGYVSAPSICDSNADKSWSARGRLYLEASMHGALQSGYNAGWAPLCIGSHYTVRTAALLSVGGLGPELAEDHSTSLMLNSAGWRGVHAVNAIAHGQGPETFADLVVQEFQWSRSLVTILLHYMPMYLSGLHGRIRFQFLFSELWYPVFSGMMALMFAMPIFALATGEHFADVTYIDFQIHALPLSIMMLVLAFWWRSTGLFRPADAKIISWEGIAFLFLRWPWALLGSLAAVWDRMTGKFVDFRITPKGVRHTDALPFRITTPYVVLALASATVAWTVKDPGTAAGFYIFNLITAVLYGLLTLLVLYRHAYENGLFMLPTTLLGLCKALSLLLITIVVVGAARDNGLKGVAAMNEGITVFTLTETVYPPAGAGGGKPGQAIIRFRPRWHGLEGTNPND